PTMRSLLLFAAALFGCGHSEPARSTPPTEGSAAAAGGQSFRDGLVALCEVPDHIAPGEGFASAQPWISEHVTNQQALALFEFRSDNAPSPATIIQRLDEAVHKNGLSSCKMIDFLSRGPRSP